MSFCRECESLLLTEEYVKRGGLRAWSSKKYYCLFRGLTLSEAQKNAGKCDRTILTFPKVAIEFQKLEEKGKSKQ